MSDSANPLLSDRDVDFLLYEVLDVDARSARCPPSPSTRARPSTCYLGACRRLAREVLFPAYRPMDERAARARATAASTCTRADARLYPRLVELGAAHRHAARTRWAAQQLPLTVAALATRVPDGRQPAAPYGYVGLTTGAAHLIEAFGSDALKRDVHGAHVPRRVDRHDGAHRAAGRLSLADVKTRATPDGRRHYLHPRLEDLHLRRRSRPHREHRAPDARAHRRRARRASRASRSSRCRSSAVEGGAARRQRRARRRA